jgi:hypothetical protein
MVGQIALHYSNRQMVLWFPNRGELGTCKERRERDKMRAKNNGAGKKRKDKIMFKNVCTLSESFVSLSHLQNMFLKDFSILTQTGA